MALGEILGGRSNVVDMCKDNDEIFTQLEEHIIPLINFVFQSGVLDFVEEAAELFEQFLARPTGMTERAWGSFLIMYEAFNSGILKNFFPELCASLYHVIRFGLGNEGSPVPAGAPEAIFTIAKTVWEANEGEDELWYVPCGPLYPACPAHVSVYAVVSVPSEACSSMHISSMFAHVVETAKVVRNIWAQACRAHHGKLHAVVPRQS